MTVLLIEDDRVGQLYPATLGRPAFSLSCGSYRLADLAARLGDPVRAVVRPHLVAPLREDAPELVSSAPLEPPVVLLNARLVPRAGVIEALRAAVARGEPFVAHGVGGTLVAALLPDTSTLPAIDAEWPTWARWMTAAGKGGAASDALSPHPLPLSHEWEKGDLPLLEHPHDLVRHHPGAMKENLEDRLSGGAYSQRDDGVFVADEVEWGRYVVTDAQQGPIVVERGARVGPLAYLRGPVWLGPHAVVHAHASLRHAVSLGEGARVGGELNCVTFEPYANKQHDGFMGHSYVGAWVNLGAGTTNSNLKNTYGTVTMRYGQRATPTDMQFMGAVVGDYAKTAVGTMIFTGKVIGAGSMVYGFVAGNVPSFVNYARSFGQVTAGDIEVLVAAQRRMFGRRGVVQRSCDAELLRAMYALTAAERTGLSVAPLRF